MIAVAALSKISGDAEHTLMLAGDGEEASRLQREHQYALRQYEKALSGMRRAIALLACLLTFSLKVFKDGKVMLVVWPPVVLRSFTIGFPNPPRVSRLVHRPTNMCLKMAWFKRLQVSTFTLYSFSISGRYRYTKGLLMIPLQYCSACRHLSKAYVNP
jgi:hypothetical protein